MKAVILAGGEAVRLRPLSLEMPKPLIPVQGIPVMQYLVDNFIAFGCTEIFIVVKKKDVKQFFNWQLVYSSIKKIDPRRIVLIGEDQPMGTFGILKDDRFRTALDKDDPDQNFFVTNADEVKDIHLKNLYKLHREKHAMATIAMTQVKDKTSFGNVYYDEKTHKIHGFVEKKEDQADDVQYISTGLYCLNKRILEYGKKHKAVKVMFEKEVFPELAQQGDLFGFTHTGQFFPTDDFKKWETAIIEYKHKSPHY
jgi:NDP-sugar pyrophosphorylase family protein